MSITMCSECQGKVSTSAMACPHCGHPLAAVEAAAASPPAAARIDSAQIDRAAIAGSEAEAEHELWSGSPAAAAFHATFLGAVLNLLLVAALLLGVKNPETVRDLIRSAALYKTKDQFYFRKA